MTLRTNRVSQLHLREDGLKEMLPRGVRDKEGSSWAPSRVGHPKTARVRETQTPEAKNAETEPETNLRNLKEPGHRLRLTPSSAPTLQKGSPRIPPGVSPGRRARRKEVLSISKTK